MAEKVGNVLRRNGSVGNMNAALLGTTPLTRQDSMVSSFDVWILQKLKYEWSSCELGPLLTKERITEAVTSFRNLETPIKIRLLLAFLSMRKEDLDASKFAMVEIIDAAENDTEEWVKVSAGLVKQYIFMVEDGADSDTYLHERLAKTSAKVLQAVHDHQEAEPEDFFCYENAFLNPSIRPEMAVKPTLHFTALETANGKEDDGEKSERNTQLKKPLLHRPQMPRPSLHPSVASVPSRMAPVSAAKPPPPPKKHMTELSEIRRKADAGRFKRQRSRISMIDIDEVKQIESEKAQKAEERKKQKVVAKEKTGSGAAASGSGGTGEKANGSVVGEEAGSSNTATGSSTIAQHLEEDEQNTHAQDRHDDHDNNDVNQGDHRGSDEDRDEYVQDGTQALLNAAFHSTQDIMNEVVSQQHQGTHHYATSHLHQQHQVPYHHGFEPEDAGHVSMGYGYGFNGGYPSHFGDQHGFHHQQDNGMTYGAGGFMDDQSAQNSSARHGGFDGTHQQNHNGGFMDGPPEYWR